MRRTAVGLVLCSFVVAALGAAPASGNSIATRDAGGGKGPLRLAQLRTGHVKTDTGRVSTLTITFDRPIAARQWAPLDFVVVAADTDGKGKNERWYYIGATGGRLHVSAYSPHYRWWYYDEARLKRVSPRSVRLTMDRLFDFEGHYYAVGSYRKDGGTCRPYCWDSIPNRGYLVHDHVAPELHHYIRPVWALADPVPVDWRVTDRGFSGVRQSTLFATDLDEREWREVARVPGSKRNVRAVPRGAEGSSMLFRITAEDGNGNPVDTGTFATSVPYDQENEAGAPLYTGLWFETEDPAAYGGTVRRSTTTADRFTFTGEGDQFCVIFRASEGEMTFSLDGGGGQFGSTWGNLGNGNHLVCSWAEYGTHTAEVEVSSGRVSVDAYWAGPSFETAAAQLKDPPPRAASGGRATGPGGIPLGDVVDAVVARPPRAGEGS